MKTIFIASVFFVFQIFSINQAHAIFGEPNAYPRICIYYHNSVIYAHRYLIATECPDVDPPNDSDGRAHKIMGDLPRSDPRWANKPGILQKIDSHDCVVEVEDVDAYH